jgi:hypothetical protein
MKSIKQNKQEVAQSENTTEFKLHFISTTSEKIMPLSEDELLLAGGGQQGVCW